MANRSCCQRRQRRQRRRRDGQRGPRPPTGSTPYSAARIRHLGGYQYPIGSIPTTPADWRAHFGQTWPLLADARRRYDPRGILTPGQGIFPVPPAAGGL